MQDNPFAPIQQLLDTLLSFLFGTLVVVVSLVIGWFWLSGQDTATRVKAIGGGTLVLLAGVAYWYAGTAWGWALTASILLTVALAIMVGVLSYSKVYGWLSGRLIVGIVANGLALGAAVYYQWPPKWWLWIVIFVALLIASATGVHLGHRAVDISATEAEAHQIRSAAESRENEKRAAERERQRNEEAQRREQARREQATKLAQEQERHRLREEAERERKRLEREAAMAESQRRAQVASEQETAVAASIAEDSNGPGVISQQVSRQDSVLTNLYRITDGTTSRTADLMALSKGTSLPPASVLRALQGLQDRALVEVRVSASRLAWYEQHAILTPKGIEHVTQTYRPDRYQREVLRVLYLSANPHLNLRTEVESRNVQDRIRRTLHRDSIIIVPKPAATPEDLLDGLNDTRPQVLHFSGHSGSESLQFDNASIENPKGRPVSYGDLARALDATNYPPRLVVFNSCDSLDGAEILLSSVEAVIAMSTSITDQAASTFASFFYGAIASAQSVGAAVRQGALGVDLAGLAEGWKPSVINREGVDVDELMLIKGA